MNDYKKRIIDDIFLKKIENKGAILIEGARQVGKSYIIRELSQKHFKNYVEVNMADDKICDKLFANVKTIEAFYIELSVIAEDKLEDRENTIVFIMLGEVSHKNRLLCR